MPPTRRQMMRSISTICRDRGGVYGQYRSRTVSWDDGQRGTVGGAVSIWGSNITDTRLWEKTGRPLFTVRSKRWNEKLGKLSADQIALVVGNHRPGKSSDGDDLTTVSLETFLTHIGEYGGYAGLPADQSLFDAKIDQEISIRFQTTFLPVVDEQKASIEFGSEMYTYNTMSDTDPKNLLILCTTQGIAIQQDGAGAKRVYHHLVDPDGKIHRHWLEAERTEHKVGKAQIETEEEKEDAIARGKATAKLIGLESMETRFNVLMTIQVPLQQKVPEPNADWENSKEAHHISPPPDLIKPRPMAKLRKSSTSSGANRRKSTGGSKKTAQTWTRSVRTYRPRPLRGMAEGTANAARVSRGTEVDIWPGLCLTLPATRHPDQHITVTVVIYNTVAGGVPSADDVIAAIDDMEALYASCKWTGRLADDGAGFVKKELTVGDIQGIADKVHHQPYEQKEENGDGGWYSYCSVM